MPTFPPSCVWEVQFFLCSETDADKRTCPAALFSTSKEFIIWEQRCVARWRNHLTTPSVLEKSLLCSYFIPLRRLAGGSVWLNETSRWSVWKWGGNHPVTAAGQQAFDHSESLNWEKVCGWLFCRAAWSAHEPWRQGRCCGRSSLLKWFHGWPTCCSLLSDCGRLRGHNRLRAPNWARFRSGLEHLKLWASVPLLLMVWLKPAHQLYN